MKKHIGYLSTLFVGIDIASRTHAVSALDFNQEFFIKMKPVPNTQEGAQLLENMVSDVLAKNHQFKYVVIGMESTGFYGVHLANFLSSSDLLAPFSVRVYCLNPKEVKNYKKSFNDIGKNDGIDSFVIADFARVGRISIKPWRGFLISPYFPVYLAIGQHLPFIRHKQVILLCRQVYLPVVAVYFPATWIDFKSGKGQHLFILHAQIFNTENAPLTPFLHT